MKSIFNMQAWRAGRLPALLFLSGLISVPFAAPGAQAVWDSTAYGSFFTFPPPVIDATNFINRGTWSIGVAPFPYRTSDTLTYTNKGQMYSSLGWAFDFGPPGSGSTSNLRNPSAIFFNDNNGLIEADDGNYSGLPDGYVSFAWVYATNIINRGTVTAGSSGQILLNGTNGTVDLSSSTVIITPATSSSSGSSPLLTSPTNIVPAKGFAYPTWAATNTMTFVSSNIWDGTFFRTPGFAINGVCPPNGLPAVVTNQLSALYTFWTNRNNGVLIVTNSNGNPVDHNPGQPVEYTNDVHEAVFVIPPTNVLANVTADVRYSASLNPTNVFDTVAVRLTQTYLNPATLAPQNNTFYLVDLLASTTNAVLFVGPPDLTSGCSSSSRQWSSYVVSRSDVYLPTVYSGNVNPPYFSGMGDGFAFANGTNGATGFPPNDFLFSSDWTNNTVVARYSALDTVINNITALPPPGGSLDHSGGRVQIYSGNLNLGQTRMSGEGWVSVQCKHLVDSVGALVDCQNLSFDLGSTNGTLIFTNLALSTVNRFSGNVSVWSATWSNLTPVTAVTWVTNGPAGWVQTNQTFIAQENLYVMLVDASGLGAPIPVTVLDLKLHAANIVVGDPVTITNSFLMDGQGLTIQNNFALSNALQNWTFNNAPTLRNFTNNGSIFVPNSAHFGDDGPTNYLAFVNNGTIIAGGQTINTTNLEINNNATNWANFSDFTAIVQTGHVAGANIQAMGAVQFSANSLLIGNSTLFAYDAINFTVADLLSDGGPGSGNNFYCDNGFNLWTKPASGDLLGTKIVDTALSNNKIYHNWAGANVGGFVAGYANNSAIGKLVFNPQLQSGVYKPQYKFYGATGNNGLYVNSLDLSQLTDFTNELYIDPSITIYYASVSVNPSVTHPGFATPEAYLNNNPSLFGPRLQWVQGVSIPAPAVASALSQRFTLSASYSATNNNFQIASEILPAQTNVIQASTDLVHWSPIYTNIGSYTNFGTTLITDPGKSNYPYRFYRTAPWP